MPSTKRSLVLAASVAAAALAVPAVASADSIVYVDHGDVWSAKPDGSAKVQLTTGGDWHSATQADDGTLAAVEGSSNRITIMARDGRVVRQIATTGAPSPDGGVFQALPRELALSPDGSKVAYSYVQQSCPPGSTCGASPEVATLVTDTDVDVASPKEKYGYNTGVDRASWASPSRLLASGGANVGITIIDLPSGPQGRRPWLTPSKDVGYGVISKDGTKFAATLDYGANTTIVFAATDGDPRTQASPPVPTIGCSASKDAGNAHPTWAPDGSGAAYQSSAGVEVVRFASVRDDGCDVGAQTVLSATGTTPTWGPADPPAARYVAPAPGGGTTPGTTPGATPGTTPGTAPGSTPGTAPGSTTTVPTSTRPGTTTSTVPSGSTTTPAGGSGGTVGAPATPARLVLGASPLRASALRRGRQVVRVDASRAGTLRVRVSSGRTTIAVGTVRVRTAGKASVRLSRATSRALAAVRGRGSVLVSATLTTPGADRLEQSRTVRFR